MFWERAARPLASLRDVFPRVLRQDLVDEGLVADAPAAGFLPKLLEHTSVDANRDELPRRLPERRAAHPAHRAQRRGRLWNVGEVNRALGTPRVRAGSHAAR